MVAAELGIDRYFAGVRPEDKSAKVQQLQAEGRRVAMVGEGVNDAPALALAQADVGIAIGAGTDVAIASAGVILASDDPRSVLSVIELSTASYRKMKQNLWWAAGYNLIAVPLAAGVLAPSASSCRCRSAPSSCRCPPSWSRPHPAAPPPRPASRHHRRHRQPYNRRATPYSRRRAPMSTTRIRTAGTTAGKRDPR